MSEYRSLYINVRIAEARLQQFFADKPVEQPLDNDWLAWWDSREMYGKQPLTQIPICRTATNRAVFDELLSYKDMVASERYDDASGSWIFVAVFYSENYTEILPMLALLKQLATYQDAEGKGVALIYDFYWGDNDVMAALTLENGQASLQTHTTIDQLDAEVLAQANRTLDATMEKLN